MEDTAQAAVMIKVMMALDESMMKCILSWCRFNSVR